MSALLIAVVFPYKLASIIDCILNYLQEEAKVLLKFLCANLGVQKSEVI